MKEIIDQIAGPMGRRELLRKGGIASLGLIGGGILAGCGGSDASIGGGGSTNQDVDVLNFALNLEYLEAEYYLRGTTGAGLSTADAGGSSAGTVKGGTKVNFTTDAYRQYAEEITADEYAHVLFLRSALGSSAVVRPNINFTDAFTAAAVAAGIISEGETFNPFADEVSFLIGAFVFEDVGVTAYHGGAGLISNKDYLSAAAGILGTEAYHAATVRTILYQIGGAAIDATTKISNLRDAVGGGKDQPIQKNGMSNIVPTDANGITFARTTREVLNIVYLGTGTNSGGFFPNGLNGTIK